MGPKADESKRFSWTAETAEDAEKDEIFPVCLWRTGTRVLWSRHAFLRAYPKEGLIGYGSVLSATSAVRNLA
jgi:hypothetical protein